MPNIAISKKLVFRALFFIWAVFSVIYILWDVWGDFKNQKLAQAYQQGRTDTVNALIAEAEKCQPFSVFTSEKQIQLIKVDCPQAK